MSDEDKKPQAGAEHTDESNVDDDELDLDDELDEDDEEDESDEDEDSEEDLTDLEKEVLEMKEEELKDPANAAKVLEAFKSSKSVIAQKKNWRDRALKAGWKKEGNEPPAKKPAKIANPAIPQDQGNGELLRRLERNEFRQDHPDIPRRMVDEIETFAKAKGVTLERAMRSPIVQKMVTDKTLKEKLSKASPSSKHRNPQTKPTIDWNTATPAQVQAHRAEVEARRAR